MESLRWVDSTYIQKHKSDNPDELRAMYYPNLKMYSTNTTTIKSVASAFKTFVARYGRRTVMSLGVYLLSMLPVVGRFVLPAASFYTFNKAVGPAAAAVVFGSGIFLPKKLLAIFLQSYFASRSLMRELVCRFISSFLCGPAGLTTITARTIFLTCEVHKRATTPLVR